MSSVIDYAQWRAKRLAVMPPAATRLSRETQGRLRAFHVAEVTSRHAPRLVTQAARRARGAQRARRTGQTLLLAAAFIAFVAALHWAAERFL
jgi:hypothetical protein